MHDDYINQIIQHYDDRAEERTQHFLSMSADGIFADIAHLLPPSPGTVADIGAGAGRDALWLARRGYPVTAVEPGARLRQAGEALTQGLPVVWRDDRLPDLPALTQAAQQFDFILLNAVWMFVPLEMRAQALATLSDLLNPGGRICLCIRRGPPTPGREYVPTADDEPARLAPVAGLNVIFQEELPDSTNRPGYSWFTVGFAKAARLSSPIPDPSVASR